MGPIAQTLPAVRAAEQNGLDGVWHAEHFGFHDAIVPTALSLAQTANIEVSLVGLSGAGRHPAVTAMELASLAEIAPGRVRAAVGTGDPGLVATLGAPLDAPLARTEALVRSLRAALSGADMHVEHGDHAFRGFRLATAGPDVPLDIMAVRPRMLKLAARLGDGVSLSVGASRQYLSESVATVEAELAAQGRDRSRFRIVAIALAVVAQDLAAARKQLMPIFAAAEPGMAEHLARGVIEPGALVEAAAAPSPHARFEVLTPDVIDATALLATPDGLADALASYAETGIDELALALSAEPQALPEIVKQVGEARPS